MNPIVLKDSTVYPDDEIVFSHIGDKKHLWELLHERLTSCHEAITTGWRYYNDGKNWLYRGMLRDKVIFWLTVTGDGFVVTFYLSSKAEPLIGNSDLPPGMKQAFEATSGNKFRSISFPVNTIEDVDYILILVKIKLKIK